MATPRQWTLDSCPENPMDRGAWWASLWDGSVGPHWATNTFTFFMLGLRFFWGASVRFPIVATPVYSPTTSAQGSLFSTSLPTFVISCPFVNSHSNWCTMIPLWFVFPQQLLILSTFSCTSWPSVFFQILYPFFNWIACFCFFTVVWVPYINPLSEDI